MPSRSCILGRVALNCISKRAIDCLIRRGQSGVSTRVASQQGFVPPTCFAVSLLLPLASSQVPAPRTTFTDTPLFEVCSAKVGPRYFASHQHFSRQARHHLSGASPFRLEYRTRCHCHLETHGTARIPSIRSASHLSNSGILLTFAARALMASPCSVTTTTFDNGFSVPTSTPGWNLGSHFPPLAGLVGMYKVFSPNSGIGVLSFRRCRLWTSVFPSLPTSHLFIKYAANPASQHSILASGGRLVPLRCSSAPSVFWPGRPRAPPHVR